MAVPDYSGTEKVFIVEVKDYCVPSSVTIVDLFVPDTLSYSVFENAQVATFSENWTTVPEVCSLEYVMGSLTPASLQA